MAKENAIHKSLCKETDGVTAVEFSLVAFPFFLIVFGIIEIGFFYGASTLLESGTLDSTRIIRTGQISQEGDPAAAFEAELCNRVNILINCAELQHEVVAIPDQDFFRANDFPAQFDADGAFLPRGFDEGGPSDVILIRSFYRYPFLVPLIGDLISPDGEAVLLSTAVIRNEPYEE